MATLTVAGLVAGALVGSGILLVLLGIRDEPVAPGRGPRTRRSPVFPYRRVLVGGACGALAALATGWPALVVIAAVAAWGIPVLFLGGRRAAEQIARVEAVQDWVRRLSDILVVGVGLGQAVTASARSAPAPLQPALERLTGRMTAGWSLEDALRELATELDDPAADLAVASLVLAQRRRGPGLASALSAIADALAEEVAARRRIEADRAKPRSTARAVTVITLGVVAVGLLTGGYLLPYRSALGQLVLVAIALVFVVALGWMHTMTVTPSRERLLAPRAGVPR